MPTEENAVVLIVDDDPDIREIFALLLTSQGYRVVSAANGAAALARLAEGLRPCLILLDLRMPVMSGAGFRDRQRSDAALSAIPTVVLSADREAEESARRLAAQGCLMKPVELADLMATVRRYCHPS